MQLPPTVVESLAVVQSSGPVHPSSPAITASLIYQSIFAPLIISALINSHSHKFMAHGRSLRGGCLEILVDLCERIIGECFTRFRRTLIEEIIMSLISTCHDERQIGSAGQSLRSRALREFNRMNKCYHKCVRVILVSHSTGTSYSISPNISTLKVH